MTKDELKQEFEKYLRDSSDYYDPREPLTERKLLQMWLDCAEPREKRIAELEAQIEQNKIDLAISEQDREHDDYELTEVYKKIEQLEKENAELKKKNLDAKEIIKKLMVFAEIDNREYEEAYKEAEQFLSEVEK